jgi:hypothetical protein
MEKMGVWVIFEGPTRSSSLSLNRAPLTTQACTLATEPLTNLIFHFCT